MNDRQRQLAMLRFVEIEAELEALAEGRIVDGDPATVEGELLGEQDEIEFALGADYLDRDGQQQQDAERESRAGHKYRNPSLTSQIL